MLPKANHDDRLFQQLKLRFPHLDLSIVDSHLTFSQNLQNIVSQLHMPAPIETRHQISSMKEAVDSQELKIQTSLVNEEDVLGNITNRALHRQRHSHPEKQTLHPIREQDSSIWQSRHDQMGDSLSDIWEFGNQNFHHRDWFHH